MEVFSLVLLTAVSLRDGLASTSDYFYSPTELNWSAANAYCEAHNGHLILPDSQDKWNEYTDVTDSLNKCSTTYWTALILDPYGCETRLSTNRLFYSGWAYSGWGVWRGNTEPNDCPGHGCVVARCTGMNTRDCSNTYIAICKTDDPTTIPTTQSVTSEIRTTTQTTPTAEVTSEVRTTTQTTPTAEVTSEVTTTTKTTTNTPKVTTAVNNSCYDCCVKIKSIKQLNNEELESAITELKSQLAVNKTNLSANRRKLISVYDSRSSSVTMGGVAIAKLSLVLSFILIPDLVSLLRFLYRWF